MPTPSANIAIPIEMGTHRLCNPRVISMLPYAACMNYKVTSSVHVIAVSSPGKSCEEASFTLNHTLHLALRAAAQTAGQSTGACFDVRFKPGAAHDIRGTCKAQCVPTDTIVVGGIGQVTSRDLGHCGARVYHRLSDAAHAQHHVRGVCSSADHRCTENSLMKSSDTELLVLRWLARAVKAGSGECNSYVAMSRVAAGQAGKGLKQPPGGPVTRGPSADLT